VIKGGTVSNVVADRVDLAVDLRVWSQDEAARVDAALKAIQPLDGTRYEITGGLNRPPMEPSEGSYQLFGEGAAHRFRTRIQVVRHASAAARRKLHAKLAPTLDGFGAFGANAHQKDLEYIIFQASHLEPHCWPVC